MEFPKFSCHTGPPGLISSVTFWSCEPLLITFRTNSSLSTESTFLTRPPNPQRFGCCPPLQSHLSHFPRSLLCSQVGLPSTVNLLLVFRPLSLVFLLPEKLPVLPVSLGFCSFRLLLKCNFPGKTSLPPRLGQSPHQQPS